jgi:hypothetical protein
MAQTPSEPVFPVGFDEDALAEDLSRLPVSATEALTSFRKELQRQGGLSKSRLKACQAEGRDRTMLDGCVKTYVPWPDGRFGAVFVAVTHPSRPLALRAIAFGIRHHPSESNAATVYEIAHKRLRDSE